MYSHEAWLVASQEGICEDCPDIQAFCVDFDVNGGIEDAWRDDLNNAHAARVQLALEKGVCPQSEDESSPTKTCAMFILCNIDATTASR